MLWIVIQMSLYLIFRPRITFFKNNQFFCMEVEKSLQQMKKIIIFVKISWYFDSKINTINILIQCDLKLRWLWTFHSSVACDNSKPSDGKTFSILDYHFMCNNDDTLYWTVFDYDELQNKNEFQKQVRQGKQNR